MEKTKKMHAKKLSEMHSWAAEEMKVLAELTTDPQMKTKYEQIAGINRMFYESLAPDDNSSEKGTGIVREIELIMRAYYVEKAVYTAACEYSVEREMPDKIDEIVDRQTLICRELLTEADQRIAVINDNPS